MHLKKKKCKLKKEHQETYKEEWRFGLRRNHGEENVLTLFFFSEKVVKTVNH